MEALCSLTKFLSETCYGLSYVTAVFVLFRGLRKLSKGTIHEITRNNAIVVVWV
jgi:hypothetical protein